MSPPTSSKILPIILYYYAMLEHTYYSQNYASIIGQGLVMTHPSWLVNRALWDSHSSPTHFGLSPLTLT